MTPADPNADTGAPSDAATASNEERVPADENEPTRPPPPSGGQLTRLLVTLVAESLALLWLGFANLPYARGVAGLTGTAIWVVFGLVAAAAALAFAPRPRDPGPWWVPATY